jgi:hypothetical protein
MVGTAIHLPWDCGTFDSQPGQDFDICQVAFFALSRLRPKTMPDIRFSKYFMGGF